LVQLTLTAYGGELTIEGVTVRAVNYNRDDIRSGGRFLLFLQALGGSAGQYQLFRGGAFEIEQQRLKPLLKHPESKEAYK
jgi:hypothetical protein